MSTHIKYQNAKFHFSNSKGLNCIKFEPQLSIHHDYVHTTRRKATNPTTELIGRVIMITIIPKPLALKSPAIAPLYISNLRSHFPPFLSSPRLNFSRKKRRRFQVVASSLVLPLLPFPVDQVIFPFSWTPFSRFLFWFCGFLFLKSEKFCKYCF